MAELIEKYGAKWPAGLDALQIEMGCIRQGGEWTNKAGVKCGLGLSRHFENMRKLLWPELDDHRWNSICRDEILRNKVTVLLGPGSSGKTHAAAWVHLCEYFCFPDETCVLVSSTDMRGLKLRVWGEISSLWSRAIEKYDYLPGHMLDSACAITTESLEDQEGTRNVRDMRKAIIGIPTMSGGRFIGLGKWVGIKQKRVRLVADEACFPAGTMVSTPLGNVPIESIHPGDKILNCIGECTVTSVSKRKSSKIVTIRSRNGSVVKCTPEHPFFTQHGWIKACELNQHHYMLTAYEAMQIMREPVSTNQTTNGMHSMPHEASNLRALSERFSSQEITRARSVLLDEVQIRLGQRGQLPKDLFVLRRELQGSVAQHGVPAVSRENDQEGVPAMSSNIHGEKPHGRKEILRQALFITAHATRPRISQEVLHGGKNDKNSSWEKENFRCRPSALRGDDSEAARGLQEIHGFAYTRATIGEAKESESNTEVNGSQTSDSWRKWNRPNRGRKETYGVGARRALELSRKNRNEERKWIPNLLQAGHCDSEIEIRCGSRWEFSQNGGSSHEGREEGFISFGDWVDSVEVHEQENPSGFGNCSAGVDVYNLEVEGHPSYTANGFLVHNCMMGIGFLSSFSNLNKNEDFRAVVLGNPADVYDPLGRAAEPLDGWDGHMEPEKTCTWKTRFMNGICVNLVGDDSPNFDYPSDQPTRFKYLISREKIADTVSFFGKDSYEYYSQCKGTMRISQIARRVLSRKLAEENHALEDQVNWERGGRTRIYFVDAAYGGDRAVGGWGEFGKIVGGKTILFLHQPSIIPITVGTEPEQQIAEFVKKNCEGLSIAPENMGHDSTGRGSLGTFLARAWSAMTNPVEAGGKATDRPVSLDTYIVDPKTKVKRLKKCVEHYSKLVSEFWFSVRYAVQSQQIRGMTEEVLEEFCMREWDRVAGDRIEIEPKQDMKERTGRSPDLADWCAGVLEMARRKGFQISKLANEAERKTTPNNLLVVAVRHRNIIRSKELTFRQ